MPIQASHDSHPASPAPLHQRTAADKHRHIHLHSLHRSLSLYISRGVFAFIILFLFSSFGSSSKQITSTEPSNALFIPPLLEGTQEGSVRKISLRPHRSKHTFLSNTTAALAYNEQSYLGPTIRLQKGDTVSLSVHNELNTVTTLHQHGLKTPAHADGNIYHEIASGETWQVQYDITQNASTLWYHPHRMGTTAEQVYFGLAGMMIVEDNEAEALSLPREYGVDDIPLIIQDKVFSNTGQQKYNKSLHTSRMGYVGNTVLVNGTVLPEFTVTRDIIRLRILNASNFGIHRYLLDGEADSYLIANDGGYLEKPLPNPNIVSSPGERVELLVDLRDSSASELTLHASIHGQPAQPVLTLRVAGKEHVGSTVPAQLKAASFLPSLDGLKRRVFNLWDRGMNNGTSINGAFMDTNHINETIPFNTYEIWEIRNISEGRGMMGMMSQLPHSFHVHAAFFTILSYNKLPTPPELMGNKDTILVLPNTTIEFLVRFDSYKGIYLYHCHLLEHEDSGMMGQFEVI